MKTAYPIDKFDLKGFIQSTLEYCKQNVSEGIEPSSAIVIFKGYSKPPKQIDDGNRDLEKEIIQDGLTLFFPFAISSLDDTISCADGKTYKIPDYDDDESAESYEEITVLPDEMNILGLTTRFYADCLVFETASYYLGAHVAPPPSIDIQEKLGFLQEPIEGYISRFVLRSDN